MTPRTMSIGGATFDLFIRTGQDLVHICDGTQSLRLPLGGKIRVKDVIETCGGGASNTSVGLKRLGCDAGFSGVMGSDQWGEKLLKNLEREGIDIRYATVVEGETSSFSIIVSAGSGERAILYDPGTNAHLHDVTFDREAASRVDWIYLNRIQEESCEIENDLIGILTAENAPHLTWNPGGCQIDVGLEAPNNRMLLTHTDLLLLNKEEAFAFTKETSVRGALSVLLAAGAGNICITDGRNGVTATDGRKVFSCPVIAEAPVVETTGAGDAFGVGATWAFISGLLLPEALRAGTINATSVVGAIGAQSGLLTETEMRHRLESVHLNVEARSL